MEISRIYVFLGLFSFVLFLESMGGSYMLSLEQKFQAYRTDFR